MENGILPHLSVQVPPVTFLSLGSYDGFMEHAMREVFMMPDGVSQEFYPGSFRGRRFPRRYPVIRRPIYGPVIVPGFRYPFRYRPRGFLYRYGPLFWLLEMLD